MYAAYLIGQDGIICLKAFFTAHPKCQQNLNNHMDRLDEVSALKMGFPHDFIQAKKNNSLAYRVDRLLLCSFFE
jgi:hypothetical protein